ncbi:hypothetical protein SAMN05444411_101187 [Lutibacter oricola]|uniref:Uncharacterized protein n=1 Tax=Lutibacter oricola TaxID=762486 RepID=A0A1H2RCG7_9FLAO|nr:hypothetical protein [Lutibacter oricola]SDW16359.1 hypothetical protein SAMN05444411_101187 [Lutibacter oricola]
MNEINLFACLAKINRELYIYFSNIQKENLAKKLTFRNRSQGDLENFPSVPIIFVWCYIWEFEDVKHEITFEIWKDTTWIMRSEYNTEERPYVNNHLKSDFLFDYSYNNVLDMVNNSEEVKQEFISFFEKKFKL